MKIIYDKNKFWDVQFSSFMSIVDKRKAFDQVVTEEEKVEKLICSLPLSFEPLVIVSSMTNMSFH